MLSNNQSLTYFELINSCFFPLGIEMLLLLFFCQSVQYWNRDYNMANIVVVLFSTNQVADICTLAILHNTNIGKTKIKKAFSVFCCCCCCCFSENYKFLYNFSAYRIQIQKFKFFLVDLNQLTGLHPPLTMVCWVIKLSSKMFI